ncbi:MAG TPA: hypothetical protein VMQ48_01485 [Candidatus Saccharimonadales bacterium]|nr:hypothetical protein [Candidatus Saccharimonadales bacterium]
MAKYNRNSGKPIMKKDIQTVKILAKKNTPTRIIGLEIGRTEDSIRKIASENSISLKPTNQSPYNRKK